MNRTRTCLLVAASLPAMMAATSAMAQTDVAQDPPVEEEIVIQGVRASQARAISIKRETAEIADAIVAEEIGKLPDVTIADSLQRVPGVQISRTAGEGGRVVIRGAPQVLGTLNGERFINSESIVNSEANFIDFPASLVSGVVVYKSQNAGITDGGVGGVIDLQTLRALKLKEGLSVNLRGEGSWGSRVGGTDFKADALIGYNFGDSVAMSLSATYGQSTSSSSFQSIELDLVDEFSTWFSPNSVDLNGDGDRNDEFLIPNGWNTYVNSFETERDRLGLAYNFNARLSDQFELIGDVMYTRMDEASHGQQLFVNGNFGGRGALPAYSSQAGNPASVVDAFDVSDITSRQQAVTSFRALTNGLRGGVQTNLRETNALNTNLELRFKGDGGFSGSVRWVYGRGERTVRALTVAQQTNSPNIPRVPGGPNVDINPGSIPTTLSYPIEVALGGNALYYNIGSQLATLAANPDAWYLHSSWLERTYNRSDQNIFRIDGRWESDNGNISIDAGLRYSDRQINVSRDDYFSPSGLPGGALTKFGEVSYAIGRSVGGTGPLLTYDPLPAYGLQDSALAPYVSMVSDFGPVRGLNVSLPMIDTRKLGNLETFRDTLYGAGRYINAPDRTYGVNEVQKTAFMKVNFRSDWGGVVLSGNAGARLVNTVLKVQRNVVNSTRLHPDVVVGVDPNHSAYVDLGDEVTRTDRTRLLPSVNLNLDIGEKLRVKAAYSVTQALQPLANLGTGEITYYDTPQIGETFQRVSTVNRLGNPNLKPWSAKSLSGAVEWYPGRDTIVSVGAFLTSVDSYTYQANSSIMVPDSDGVVRNGATLQTIQEGEGASYYGIEAQYQQNFSFLPGFLKHLGASVTYTFSPSQAGRDAATGEELTLADGTRAPFNDTAEHQLNAVLWYQDSKFQARIAANYMTDLYQGTYGHWSYNPPAGTAGVGNYQQGTFYLDFGASYDVNENFQVFVNGSNLTEEAPVNYAFSKQFKHTYNQFERVISAGIRARF